MNGLREKGQEKLRQWPNEPALLSNALPYVAVSE